jgi:hypothetical protein
VTVLGGCGGGCTYIGDGDGLLGLTTKILEQVLDEDGALGDSALWLHDDAIGGGDADQLDVCVGGGGGHCDYWVCVLCRVGEVLWKWGKLSVQLSS